jgi:hypothetical protein
LFFPAREPSSHFFKIGTEEEELACEDADEEDAERPEDGDEYYI